LLISEDTGCTKDHPEIYRRALAAAKVSAERALMIGDRIDLDVAVPQSLGMKAVWLKAHAAPSFIPSKLEEKYAGVQPEKIFENWNELERWLRKIMP
jgi:FMN phosphatase YigB (HAD superfamily)